MTTANEYDLNELKTGCYYKYCNVVGGRVRISRTEERWGNDGYLCHGDVFLVAEKILTNSPTKGFIYKILGPTTVGYVRFTKYQSNHELVHYAEELDLD